MRHISNTTRTCADRMITAIAGIALLCRTFAAVAQETDRGRLRIITKPKDATIIIDNRQRGSSPLSVEIPHGKHLLTVRKSDYLTVRKTVNVAPGQISTCELHLKPVTGLVLIHSEPAGADVNINNASRGTTPLFISDMPLGSYHAVFTKPGYIPKEIEIQITGRNPKKYSVRLTPDSGTLIIQSTPPGKDGRRE